ncbi:uncharacterized protein LOC126987988 isoform X2 [Eriocheir sinensis]|uniref:uncharacterized protein LOC126987988 isoform X2 n=1 Tax=Eriocheir sinensis TaxID=95602 RepID=UPI0021C5D03B|nr:uncharacterized protein LOC126987988 isoform X2 [Eriocheir sinensis]
MALGEGSRKVGEPCWSHAQCKRSEKNSYCSHLVCVCDSEFHDHDGQCSRNYWEDLGLQNWQLLTISLVIMLFFLAVFVGCLYYVFLRIVRKYRRTRPSGDPPPTNSFQVIGGSKKNSLAEDSAAQDVKKVEMRQSMRRKSLRIERTRSQLLREREIMEREREEQQEEEERRMRRMARIKTVTEVDVGEGGGDVVPVTSIRPLTKFILPLHYSNNQGEGEERGRQKRNLRRNSSFGSWSLSSWEMEPLEAGLDWWPRRQFRRPINKGEAASTRLPLLLSGSASESDESE